MNFATWFFFYIYHCKATICKAYFIRLDINTSQFNLFRWKLLVVKQHALQESKEIKRWVKEIKLSRRVSGVIYGACCHGNAGEWFQLAALSLTSDLSECSFRVIWGDIFLQCWWPQPKILDKNNCSICSLFPMHSVLHVFMWSICLCICLS